MPTAKDTARLSLIHRIGELAALAGFGRTTAQTYALLLLSEQPLSLDDMASALGLSKASLSVSVRELASREAVHKVWSNGSRRDLWEAEDLSRALGSWARTGMARRLEQSGALLEEAERFLAASRSRQKSPGKAERRVAAARALHRKISGLAGMLPELLDELGKDR